MDQDREHLRLLSIFHWVVAGIAALFAFFPVIHFVIGIALVSGRFRDHRDVPFTRVMGWFFILFAGAWIFCSLAYAVGMVIAGRQLAERRSRMFCLVMAGISCAFFPFGTVLGIFTIVVLSKDSVRAMFAGSSPAVIP